MNRFKLYFMNLYFYTFFLYLLRSSSRCCFYLFFCVAGHAGTPRYEEVPAFHQLVRQGHDLCPFPVHSTPLRGPFRGASDRSYIFVCNHRAASDAFLMCVLPVEAVQVVNTWPFHLPVLGRFARMAGYLNIKK